MKDSTGSKPDAMSIPSLIPAIVTVPDSPEQYPNQRKFQGIPSIETLPDNSLIAVWYTGGREEGPDNFCIVARSVDGGASWTDPWLVIRHPIPHVRCFDPNVWYAPDGSLWLFWNQTYSLRGGNTGDGMFGVWTTRCQNPLHHPMKWDPPMRIANGIMMNKPSALSDGTWAYPTALWNDLLEHGMFPVPAPLRKERFSNLTVSTDGGTTFSLRGSADVPERSFDEHQIVELRDGRLWMLVRTNYGIGQSFSSDRGRSWSPGTHTSFRSPNSRFCLRRLSSGRLLLVNNDDDSSLDYHQHPWRPRRNLTASLSEDDGRTWSDGLLLDARAMAYPDAAEDSNGCIYVICDYLRHQGGFICLSKITEEDILAGKLVSETSFLSRIISSFPYSAEDALPTVLTPLEKQIKADEPFALMPPPIMPVSNPPICPKNTGFIQAGGFERIPNGRIWTTWAAGEEEGKSYLMNAWSDDDGRTWTRPKFMIPCQRSPRGFTRNHGYSMLWSDPKGRLWWFFDARLGSFDGRSGTWYSVCNNPDDEQPNWTPPTRIWHGTTRNRPLILENGTWIIGIALWGRERINGFPAQDWTDGNYAGNYTRELDDDRKTWIFASEDQGKTWTRRGGVWAGQRDRDEPSIIQRKDGSLLMYIRTFYGLAEAESFDLGMTWTAAKPSPIRHPPARLFTCRLNSGRLLMVGHDRPDNAPPLKDNLTAWLSEDEAKTWHGGFPLETNDCVSDPDGFQHPDGRIFIQYSRGNWRGDLMMAVFTEEDVAAGHPVSGKTMLGKTMLRNPT